MNELVAFLRPYDHFYAVKNWVYWAWEMDFEFQMCRNGCFVFLGLQFFELFALLLQKIGEPYASVPAWSPPYDSSCLFSVPMHPVFLYHSCFVIDNRVGVSCNWHIELIEFACWQSYAFLLSPALEPSAIRAMILDSTGVLVRYHLR